MRLVNAWPRAFRAPEFWWLLLSVIVCVTALSSVVFMTTRLKNAFELDARKLLAADLVIQSDGPTLNEYEQQAKTQHLQTVSTVTFPTMAFTRGQTRLVALKAIQGPYPLRGELLISNQVASKQPASGGPPLGQAWVDTAVLEAFKIRLGDSISLGQLNYTVTATIDQELDRGAGFMNFAPRVMISKDRLEQTGLIGFGSRVTYRLLVSGESTAVHQYQVWAQERLEQSQVRGMRIESIDNAQPFMRNTLNRAEQFLSLVALLTTMICAIATALTAYRYIVRQARYVAVMKCLGATRSQILGEYLRVLLWLVGLGGVIGSILGWGSHWVLLYFLKELLALELPGFGWWPLVWSWLVAAVLVLACVFPAVLRLARVTPLMIFRKEALSGMRLVLTMGITSVAGLFLLMGLMANNWLIAAIVLGGFTALFILAFSICVLVIRIGANLGSWLTWRHALLGLVRRYFLTGLQAASLAVAVMSLLLMLVIKNDLLAAWQANHTSGTPNRFLINIQPDQKEGVHRMLKGAAITDANLYPMVRGRLIEINDKMITPDDFADDRAQRLVDREFNLSYGQSLPPGNRIVGGSWHGTEQGNQLSLEEGLAKTLGLRLGDRLTFDVAATRVTATVTSIRALDWSSLRVNFFAILTPQSLVGAPQTWITAYRQESIETNLDADLVARYPNLTVVNVDASLRQVQGVLDQLSKAVEYLFGLALAAASLVLMSTLSAMKEERQRDAALFKTLGASVGQVRFQFLIQLLVLGAVSGLLASAGAAVIAWALAHFVLEMAVTISWALVPYALTLACGVSLASGYRAWAQVATVPTVRLLQESV